MNIKQLIFGNRTRVTTEASIIQTDASTTSPTEAARLFEISTITVMLLLVAAASFVVGFLFWGFMVLCKRRSRQVSMRGEIDMNRIVRRIQVIDTAGLAGLDLVEIEEQQACASQDFQLRRKSTRKTKIPVRLGIE